MFTVLYLDLYCITTCTSFPWEWLIAECAYDPACNSAWGTIDVSSCSGGNRRAFTSGQIHQPISYSGDVVEKGRYGSA
jgi:hypothetical protein